MTQHLNKSHRGMNQKLVIICVLCIGVVSCAKQSRSYPESDTPTYTNAPAGNSSRTKRVNINSATEEELKTLPGIGDELSARIVIYRKRSGPFRKPEHLLLVDGISEGRLKEILPFITVE